MPSKPRQILIMQKHLLIYGLLELRSFRRSCLITWAGFLTLLQGDSILLQLIVQQVSAFRVILFFRLVFFRFILQVLFQFVSYQGSWPTIYFTQLLECIQLLVVCVPLSRVPQYLLRFFLHQLQKSFH